MQTLRNKLIAVAAVGVLAVIGSLMGSREAVAQGPADGLAVKIVNPLPVPVTGSTTVSGTVAATQSGAWNVGITGIPNVHALVELNGGVLECSSSISSAALSMNCEFPAIPAQKKFIGQTGFCSAELHSPALPSGASLVGELNNAAAGPQFETTLPQTRAVVVNPPQNGVSNVISLNANFFGVFDSGQVLSAGVIRADQVSLPAGSRMYCGIHGYLVDK